MKSSLEEILREYFGCEKPFLEEVPEEEAEGNNVFEYFTKSGSRAYTKLVGLLYDLDELGVLKDIQLTIEALDEIVSGKEY